MSHYQLLVISIASNQWTVPPARYHGLYSVKILVQFCQLLYHCIRLNTLSCRKKNWSLQLLDPSINPNVNRPPGEESVGKLVEPVYAKINSFIGVSLASTVFIPLSLMHEAISISSPRSFHEGYLCYNCCFNFTPFIESISIVTNRSNIYVWIYIKIVWNKILRTKKARVYHK